MKNSIYILLAFITFFEGNLKAQKTEDKKGIKNNTSADFALGSGKNQLVSSLSAVHFYGIGKNKQFKIGYGLRYTGYWGKNRDYITAPAELTSGKTGPQVLFSEIDPNNYDTVNFSKTQTNSINASINLQYSLSKKLDIGFNIDAIGYTFGSKKSGIFSSSANSNNFSSNQDAKPTAFNLLLISDNDKGSLNSELYVRYWVKDKIGIKGGLTFLFTEYTTTNKLVLQNDRWRNKSLLPMLAVTYKLF